MAGINISDISKLDYVKLYRWEISISGVAPVTGAGVVEAFKLRVTTANLPSKTNTPIEVNIGAHSVSVDGKIEFDKSITMSCVESPSMDFTNMIETWMELIQKTKEGTGAKKAETRGEIIMKLLGDNNEILATYALASVSPQSMAGAALGSDSEVFRPDITWNYEYYLYNPKTNTGNTAAGPTNG